MRKWIIAFALGTLVLAIATSQEQAQTVSPNPWGPGAESPFQTVINGIRPAPDCHTLTPACPPSLQSGDLLTALDLPTFLLNPPGQHGATAIDAANAENIAWQEGGGFGDSQQALLTLLPAGGSITCGEQPVACGGEVTTDTLVWAVRYFNGCAYPSGVGDEGVMPSPICGITTTVLIDANTGDFISAFEIGP
jgi:hypothetical protein